MTAATLPEPAAPDQLDQAVELASQALRDDQRGDGHWCFELEADCTIPAEYVLYMHFNGRVDTALEQRLAVYLRGHQDADGSWPLYPGGAGDLSCTVKAYFALKLAGDPPAAPHMTRARQWVLARGGAARANVFTRIALALFRQVPWRAVPFMPVEIMLLPRWAPFHLSKVSYWSRTVMVPLLVLYTTKPAAANPRAIGVRELFTVAPEHERDYFPTRSRLNRALLRLERTGRRLEPLLPRALRRRALARAERWLIERLNGRDGLGAIFPAMVNADEALAVLGYAPDHPLRQDAQAALRALIVDGERAAYCQPCVSPVWDTVLSALALQEVGDPPARRAAAAGLDWLLPRQLRDAPGDWREYRPDLPGGGWPFQYRNDHYPDLDDTAAIGWALLRGGTSAGEAAAERATDWVAGMQSSNGGFAAFDADNTHEYLNELPFADHGALLDPPTADVSARCLMLLARRDPQAPPVRRCLAYLRAEQTPAGAWFGRWGTNYIYGTWSVLMALEEAGVPGDDPAVRAAAHWLRAVQRADGGWGESNDSYEDPALAGHAERSTAFQTAWALLGLMAAGEADSQAVRRGIAFLLARQQPDGLWSDPEFTAPGFPRVFYLKYHGYSRYFPLWALARYRRERNAGHS